MEATWALPGFGLINGEPSPCLGGDPDVACGVLFHRLLEFKPTITSLPLSTGLRDPLSGDEGSKEKQGG